MLEGRLGLRHGVDKLASTWVCWDAVSGEQHPVDWELAKKLKSAAMED